MRRPRSKSLLRRLVEKALPNTIAGRNSPEYSPVNVPKAVSYKYPDATLKGTAPPRDALYIVNLGSHVDPDWDLPVRERQSYHSETPIKPSQPRSRANSLSTQTQNFTADGRAENTRPRATRLNLDHFIQKIESWTPPSPREVLARRLFREVQQTTSAHPRTVSHQPSTGGYLVHRRIKSGCTF